MDARGWSTLVNLPDTSICNKKPDPETDKVLAEDWVNYLLGGDMKTEFHFKYPKGDFSCFPPPPKIPPVYPTKGVGSACRGLHDDCSKDSELCCGLAKDGYLVDEEGVNVGVVVPDIPICNNKLDADGKSKAIDYKNKLLGADRQTEFRFIYPSSGFECFKDQKPPAPPPSNQPAKPHNDDSNLGG
jgi:hypothetical protein